MLERLGKSLQIFFGILEKVYKSFLEFWKKVYKICPEIFRKSYVFRIFTRNKIFILFQELQTF